jgi:FkbM family methyltransferase
MNISVRSSSFSQISPPPLAVYGFGVTGKSILDDLLANNVKVELILDKNKSGNFYQGIPIKSIDQIIGEPMSHLVCLITLHNHYIDLSEVTKQLQALKFSAIINLAGANEKFPFLKIEKGYWLNYSFSYKENFNKIQTFLSLLEDKKSLKIANDILKFRSSGDIDFYPNPSILDEYTPLDLPRYSQPLNLVDCGAFTGVAIEKLIKAGYSINKVLAFEPDLKSFNILSQRNFKISESIFMPNGTWSSNEMVRFQSDGSMASSIDDNGNEFIQLVKLDDVQENFQPNLIKLDVEGAELNTLIGAQKTIKKYKPNLLVSTYHTPSDFFEIGLLIKSWNLGYKFHLRVHEHNSFGVVLYCLQDNLTESFLNDIYLDCKS